MVSVLLGVCTICNIEICYWLSKYRSFVEQHFYLFICLFVVVNLLVILDNIVLFVYYWCSHGCTVVVVIVVAIIIIGVIVVTILFLDISK